MANTNPTFTTTLDKVIFLVSAGSRQVVVVARNEAQAMEMAAEMGKTSAERTLVRASWRCPSGTINHPIHEERCAKLGGRTFKSLKAAWEALEGAGLR